MKFYYILIFTAIVCSCRNKEDKPKDVVEAAAVVEESSVKPAKPEKAWIDDFKEFRQAVDQKDLATLKTYFDFPFDDQGKTIFHLCNLTDTEWAKRKEKYDNAELFYEEDLEKYHDRIFNKEFLEMILKIKSDRLLKTHSFETQLIEKGDGIYQMFVDYNNEENTLILNMAIGNSAKDENGEYVSEGESNIIYRFKITEGQKLKLARIDIAG